eukprot:GGOE01003318.1.p1 GENE.GGOE01003318.1~~GGOE01003318.1.p1  ORF type:complete len:370 (-),score=68.55 GGOE01003318.1:35-1144(-)
MASPSPPFPSPPPMAGSCAHDPLAYRMEVWLAWLLAGMALSCQGTVVFTGVLPHGDFAYDPSLVHNLNGSLEIHRAALRFAEMLSATAPEVLLLSTPHGLSSSQEFLLYSNSEGKGFAAIGRDLHDPSIVPYDIRLDLHLGANLTKQLLVSLKKAAVPNVALLSAFGNADPIPLGWGEVVPLGLLQRTLDLNRTQLLILTQPSRRSTAPVAMIPELHQLGAALFDTLHGWPQRVAVVISGDLAHTHLASGPYGYSPAAAPFDAACGMWTQTLESQHLTVRAAELVQRALSCGFTGMVMLDGMLQRSQTLRWWPCLLARAHPTYYGMLVAAMIPAESQRANPVGAGAVRRSPASLPIRGVHNAMDTCLER